MATETVRFSRVVEEAGQPETYTLWMPPDQDKVFATLLRQNRVMTVHQQTTGSKADYGTVGYTEDRHRSLLVFHRSLKRFAGQRIIGIKYDDLQGVTAQEHSPVVASAVPTRSPAPARKPKEKKPAPKKALLPKEQASPPPPNQIPFPKPEIVKREKPGKPENPAAELASLKKTIKKALDALAQDKPVTAFNLLQATLE